MESKHTKDPISIEIDKLDRNVKRILWFGAPILILIPILTTQLDWFFDFTKTGNIGDTLGGITAPVIGVVSALLIYFSFRAQITANRIIQGQIDQQREEDNEKKEFNYQMEVYKHLKEVIESFVCKDETLRGTVYTNKEYKGYEALRIVLKNLGNKQYNLFELGSVYHRFIHPVLNQFDSIIESFQNTKNCYYDIRLPLQLVEFLFNDRIWNIAGHTALKIIENPEVWNNDVLWISRRIINIERKLSLISQAEELRQQGQYVLRG